MAHSSLKPRYWHYWISLLLVLAMVPLLRRENLPFKFDWITLGIAYWCVLAAQSVFAAVLFGLIGLRREQILLPWLTRYRENPARLIPLVLFVTILVALTGWLRATVLSVDAIVLLELLSRRKTQELRQTAGAILAPAAYLFFGFLMVLAYNNIIVSLRYNFLYDPALAAADRWLLHGHSVWEFSHWAVRIFPLSFFNVAELIYFGMFLQIGATMIFLALCMGRGRALQFVGTILLSYYVALVIFYIWPAQGPYFLCPRHFSRFPPSLQAYNIQKTLILHALALWHHAPIARISSDYFIGLPCMHLVQPLIVLWFLRPWRRLLIALVCYDVLLVVAILMIEMHYAIDIVAALPVAAIAIAITDGSFRNKKVSTALSAALTPP